MFRLAARAVRILIWRKFYRFRTDWVSTIDQIDETDYELTIDAGGRSIGQYD